MKYVLLIFFLLNLTQLFAQNGLVTNYYQNGKVESEIFYIKGIIDGTSRWYYYYGVLKEERNYILGKLNGWHKTFYENGAPKMEVYYNDGKRDGISKEFYVNGGLKKYYKFDNGLLLETRTFSYDSLLNIPKIVLVDKKGNRKEIIPGKDTLESNKQNSSTNLTQTNSPDSIYYIAMNEYPEPVDGINSIYEKINLSESFKQKKPTGEMILKIYVDENGKVTNTEIIKGLDPIVDPLVNGIVQRTKFNPGRKKGVPIKAQKNLYLNFNGIVN